MCRQSVKSDHGKQSAQTNVGKKSQKHPSQVFVKKGGLKDFANFTENTCVESLF